MKLKKLFAGLISLAAALLAVCAITVCAGAETSGDYEYEILDDGTVKITDYTGSAANLTIPSTIGGKTVTSIGGGAFEDCSTIFSITIPDSVTNIEYLAFIGTSNLTSITVGNNNENYTSIDGILFNKDKTLLISCPENKKGAYYIPDGVEQIYDRAFVYCSNLTSIYLPKSVEYIQKFAFAYCSNLESLTVDSGNRYYSSENGVIFNKDKDYIRYFPEGKSGKYSIPNGVKEISDYIFSDCAKITSINIPSSVTSIGEFAFSDCTGLTSMIVPEGVKSIGDNAFYNCEFITTITLPKSLTDIGNGVFRGCSKLTSINIPDGITSIGNNVFFNCSSLPSIKLPDGLTSIGNNAFYGCSSLVSIDMPDSVKSIGYDAFSGTPILNNQTTPIKYVGKWVINCDDDVTTETIKNGTIAIGDSAFMNCRDLTTIKIPDSVTSIGDSAFAYCASLTSITIPDGVTSLGEGAFNGCLRLPSITIPDGVTSIGYATFQQCTSLTSITLPESITNIGSVAFNACTKLTDVYYAGSKAQWNTINISSVNSYLKKATIHYGKHVSTDPIIENKIPATCGKDGSYDEVVYCSDCGEVISRTTVSIPATGKHTATAAVKENVKNATCAKAGSYDEVVYCSVCKKEISRKTVPVPATGKHTASATVKENVKDATCITDGSYDEVVYCSVCKKELSRTPVTVPATGKHTYIDKVVSPTYTAQGYTEHTCSVCGYSYKDTYTAKKTVSAVTGLSLKGRSADALRLAWNKNTTADGYIIEMKDGTKWTRVVKITKNSTTEYRIAKLATGTAYNFRIRAYKMDGKTALYSGYTTISARTNPSAVTGLKLKGRSGDALRISWTKNTSADGYIIEMKDGSKWVRVGKVTKNSTVEFRKDKLKAGTAYTFRVKAYKMSGKTALYGATKTISVRTNPSVVSGLKLKNSAKDAVRLSWTKNTSADGYIVEMKVNGVWKRAGKISKNSTVEFKKSGLKSKTSYTFRVKAYKMSGKTALYSGYKTITVKTK